MLNFGPRRPFVAADLDGYCEAQTVWRLCPRNRKFAILPERLIESPIPSPPGFVVRNAVKICSRVAGSSPIPGVTDRHHHIHLTAVLRASDEVTSPALNLRPDRRGHDRRLRDGLRTSKTLPLFLHPAQLAGACFALLRNEGGSVVRLY